MQYSTKLVWKCHLCCSYVYQLLKLATIFTPTFNFLQACNSKNKAEPNSTGAPVSKVYDNMVGESL